MTGALRACAVMGLLLAAAPTARAEAPREIADANAAAAAGDWARVEQIVAPLATVQVALADRAELDRLWGLADYFQGHLGPAEDHLLAFLRIDPDGSLDPALYPPEALAFLEGIKTRHRAEIAAQRPHGHRYFILNFVPYLAQAQNGERSKGLMLGGALGGFLIGQAATYLVLRSWCSETTVGGVTTATCDDHGNHVHAATELRTINLVLGVAAGLTYAYGVYDGVTRYRIRSRELSLQPFASSSEHTQVFGVAGTF